MSTFTAPIGVGNIDNREFVYVDALVDTGATYSMFPREFLEDIHVEQSWTIDSLPMGHRLRGGLGQPICNCWIGRCRALSYLVTQAFS